jgi:hypothetical protein
MRISITILLMLLLAIFSEMAAQNIDNDKERQIEQTIESFTETKELANDNSVELDDLTRFADNPLNINTVNEEELQKLIWLDFSQVSNLIAYRKKNGSIMTIYELAAIEGFDEMTIRKITPFIYFGPTTDNSKMFSLNRINQRVIIRAKTTFPVSRGYNSADGIKSAAYPGNPFGYYFRYKAEASGKYEFGFTADNDAGEDFFKGTNKSGFDYYSWHLAWRGKGLVRQVNLGDFHLRFGQGLSFWTGSGVNKSVEALNIMRSGQGIRSYSSVDENIFFRGGAVTLAKGAAKLSLFYSNKNRDANIDTDENGDTVFTSLQTSGLHRTLSEIQDEKSINEMVTGAFGEVRTKNFRVGALGIFERFSLPMAKGTALYKSKSFEGTENFNLGVDYQLSLNRIQLFGETGLSKNLKPAIVQGALWHLNPQLGLSFYYRYFDPEFHTFYGNALSESSGSNNETGFYTGFELLPLKKVRFTGYVDIYRFPWITFGTAAPENGNDLMVQMNYSLSRKVNFYIRTKYETKPQKLSGSTGIPSDYDESTGKIRCHLDWQLSDRLTLRTRFEYADYAYKDISEKGYLAFQDIVFAPSQNLNLWFRYVLYNTDGYNSRIYAYENDLLYYYSTPAFFGEGSRIYLNLKWEPVKLMTFYVKAGRLLRKNIESIGSGYDETIGNYRNELRAQLYLRF